MTFIAGLVVGMLAGVTLGALVIVCLVAGGRGEK